MSTGGSGHRLFLVLVWAGPVRMWGLEDSSGIFAREPRCNKSSTRSSTLLKSFPSPQLATNINFNYL